MRNDIQHCAGGGGGHILDRRYLVLNGIKKVHVVISLLLLLIEAYQESVKHVRASKCSASR